MNNETVKILITGDFCPINRVEELSKQGEIKSIFNDFIEELKGNDLNIVDLECPLTNSETTRPKTGPYQKAHPITINALKYADVSAVTMSNNHIMDYDSKGVQETLNLCSANGIETIGIGKSGDEASKIYSVNIKGKKIGILTYADNEFLTTSEGIYSANPLDTVKCYYDIKEAKESHHYVIVIVHGGNEFYNLPSPRTKKLFRYIVDVGADVVLSHHTHVFSGYEQYNGKPIFYGLGNFVYDWPGKVNSDWNRGYAVRLEISDNIDYKIIPLKQGNEQPGVFKLSQDEKVIFSRDIEMLSKIISDDIELEKRFQEYCESVFPMYDAFIEPYFGKYIMALQKRGFLPKLLSRKKRLFHLNLSRCESHREVLLRMLHKYECK